MIVRRRDDQLKAANVFGCVGPRHDRDDIAVGQLSNGRDDARSDDLDPSLGAQQRLDLPEGDIAAADHESGAAPEVEKNGIMGHEGGILAPPKTE